MTYARVESWSHEYPLGALTIEHLWGELEEILELTFPADTDETLDRYRKMTPARFKAHGIRYRSMGRDVENPHHRMWAHIGAVIGAIEEAQAVK